MEEWKTYKLSDVADLTTGFPFDGHKYAKEGIRVVRGDNVTIGSLRWDADKDKRWNEPFTRAAEFTLQDGDIVIGMDGSRVGKNRAQISKSDLPLLIAQRVACIRHNARSCQEFLYYQVFSDRFVEYIKAVQTGTSIPHVSLKQIGDFPVKLPSIDEQNRIAGVLRALDDKITLNNRINHNLEEQARELFKYWFINAPQESWKEKSLSDYFNVITGKKDSNYSTPEGAYPFFTCSQDILKAPSYSFDGHAILVAGNGDFNVKRYIGKFEAYQRTYVLIPHEEKFHAFLYLMIDYYLPEITGGSRGSVIKFITKGNIANFRFRVPQNNIDDQLKKLNDIYKIIDCNLEESSRLTKMRDTLLPKLMTGELKINDLTC